MSELSTPAGLGRRAPRSRRRRRRSTIASCVRSPPVDIPGNSPSLGGEIHPCYERPVVCPFTSCRSRTSTAALRGLDILNKLHNPRNVVSEPTRVTLMMTREVREEFHCWDALIRVDGRPGDLPETHELLLWGAVEVVERLIRTLKYTYLKERHSEPELYERRKMMSPPRGRAFHAPWCSLRR